jgi:threonine dehydratase
VKKTDVSGNTVTVQVTGGGLIDGAATALIAVAGESIHVVSDGTAHYVI